MSKRIIAAGAALIVVGSLGACNKATTEPTSATAKQTFTASGTLKLHKFGIRHSGDECWGTGGYGDIDTNAQVVVRDGAGKVLAFSTLEPGHVARRLNKRWVYQCDFPFKVHNVPSGLSVYSVEVSHRGQVNFHEAEAPFLVLSLGNG